MMNEGEGGLWAPGKRGVIELVTDKYTTGPALWVWQLTNPIPIYHVLPIVTSPCSLTLLTHLNRAKGKFPKSIDLSFELYSLK